MMSIGWAMAGQLIVISCPECSTEFEIQVLDVITQVTRTCPCCRLRIHLIDGGDASGELAAVDRTLSELDRAIERLS